MALRIYPCKQTAYIPRWNNVETFVYMSFQRGIHVVCLWRFSLEHLIDNSLSYIDLILSNKKYFLMWSEIFEKDLPDFHEFKSFE